ncbi:MAG TPA: hypothetical protein VMP01_19335 [Pirellulaceae bacterium]|nr:hypothetical protein [Pirellulaceae bacterium]
MPAEPIYLDHNATTPIDPSPTLLAMGLEKSLVEGSIRLSLGALNTAGEVEEAARRILMPCGSR